MLSDALAEGSKDADSDEAESIWRHNIPSISMAPSSMDDSSELDDDSEDSDSDDPESIWRQSHQLISSVEADSPVAPDSSEPEAAEALPEAAEEPPEAAEAPPEEAADSSEAAADSSEAAAEAPPDSLDPDPSRSNSSEEISSDADGSNNSSLSNDLLWRMAEPSLKYFHQNYSNDNFHFSKLTLDELMQKDPQGQ